MRLMPESKNSSCFTTDHGRFYIREINLEDSVVASDKLLLLQSVMSVSQLFL
jgi:hypothetical protein